MNQASDNLIGFFVRHSNAGNLLMALMILFGLFGWSQISRQVMPSMSVNIITVTVDWPGAGPEDVDSNIINSVEQAVRFLSNVEEVESIAIEGRGVVTISFFEGTDMSAALGDVQAAVARITTFPKDIERPVISEIPRDERVLRMELSGPFSEQALKHIANGIRDDLLNRGLSKVMVLGARNSEIWVEVPQHILRELSLTIQDISARIARASLDLPSGDVKIGGAEKLIRSEGSGGTPPEISDIEIVSGQAGEKVLLGDIAKVTEEFADNAVSRMSNGITSISLDIMRSAESDSIKAQLIVDDYIRENRTNLPSTLRIEQHDVYGASVRLYIENLATNALIGLAIIGTVLLLFFRFRMAIWIAASIPIAILVTLGMFNLMGMSLNIISMFTIILGLGIVVDDAIVVGDRIASMYEHGATAEVAAQKGASEMFPPILAASLTTIAAFVPMLTIGTYLGQILAPIPLTIIFLIVASFIECFLILPAHLRSSLLRNNSETSKIFQLFDYFRDHQFRRMVHFCFHRRYTTIVLTLCVFSLAIMTFATGRVNFEFDPGIEGDITVANFSFTPGTPRERTIAMVRELERASRAAAVRLNEGDPTLIKHSVGIIGAEENPQQTLRSDITGNHLGSFIVELESRETRSVYLYEFIRAWEEEIQPLPGIEQLSVMDVTINKPPGKDIEMSIHGAEFDLLKKASLALREEFSRRPGVSAVQDNAPFGKQELVMVVTPTGKAMGLTNESVAQQVRNAFQGSVAKRIPGEDEEIRIRVKLSDFSAQRNVLRMFYLRTPDGSAVPLTEVVDIETRVGPSSLRRFDGVNQITVSAEIDQKVTLTNDLLADLSATAIPKIERAFGVEIELKGRLKRDAKAFADIGVAFQVATVAIYIILAWVFASYTTPLIAMSIIPFGLIGVITGHYLFGLQISYLGMMGIMGLMGVMINDSIILILAIKKRLSAGESLESSIMAGTRERLRPIFLTTVTTVGVLIPIIFDQGLTGEFYRPLAITMAFGMLVSMVVVLTWIPALLVVSQDIRQKLFSRSVTKAMSPANH